MNEILKAATVSWKTTFLGALVLVEALAVELQSVFDNDPSTVANWNMVVIAATAFVGLLLSKDADKSTEDHKPARSRFNA